MDEDDERRRAAYETERRASMARTEAQRVHLRGAMAGDPSALRRVIDEAAREMAPLHARRDALLREIRLLQERFMAAHDVLAETVLADAGDEPDWAWLLDSGNLGDAALDAWMRETGKLGLLALGSWERTGERAVTIALVQDSPRSLRRTAEGLRTLMPHMKPHPDGWLRFRVMDNGEAGDADELLVSPDGARARLTRRRGGFLDLPGLDAALSHVQECHWNERYEDVYQEDEPEPSPGPR